MAKESQSNAKSKKSAKKAKGSGSSKANAKPEKKPGAAKTPAAKPQASKTATSKTATSKTATPKAKGSRQSGASKRGVKKTPTAAKKKSRSKSDGAPSASADLVQSSAEGEGEENQFDLADIIHPEHFIPLKAQNKSEAIAELCQHAAKLAGMRSSQEILMEVLESESRLTTKMGPNWATPHARIAHLPKQLIIVVGKSESGIPYDGTDEQPVNLIILLLADEDTSSLYLRALAAIVENLRKEKRVDAILRAKTGRGMRSALVGVPSGRRVVLSRQLPPSTRMLVRNMLGFAKSGEVGSILLAVDAFEQPEVLKSVVDERTLLLTERHTIPQELSSRARGVIRLPFSVEGESMALRLAIVLALGRKLISRKERVLAMIGPTGSNRIDLMRLFDAKDFPVFDLDQGGESSLSPGVLERVIELAARIADEGREGYPVGTIFMLCDPNECKPFVRQLVINPFRGYESEELNVMDLTLEETIKEYSSIDGAFIVDMDGQLVSAGTFLIPESKGEVELASGLGTRHRSAIMMTKCTNSIAVVVSSSTGGVSVFFKGKQVMHLSIAGTRRASNNQA